MEELISYLLQFGQLNLQQIELIKSKTKEVTLQKETYFLEAGSVCRQISFIRSGVMMTCYYNNKGEEIVHHFVVENNFIVDLESFNQRISAMIYIKAITDCELISFSYDSFKELSSIIIEWDSIVSKITIKTLLNKVNLTMPMEGTDATKPYLDFLQIYPNLANRIPLTYIASYLGITATSLSRIRKNIS